MLGRYRGKREAARAEKTDGAQAGSLGLEEALEQAQGGEAAQPGQTSPRRKLGAKKIALIAAGTVAVLAVAVAGAWALFVRPPEVKGDGRPVVQETGRQDQETREPADEAAPEEEPEAVSDRKEDYYTFLLVGEDISSGSTDTIMLVSYDVAEQAVNFLSIPRDTMVNVSWDIKRINSVYASRPSSGGGIEGLKAQVGTLTGVEPDFYVVVEWAAVGRVVDALDGVWFDVPFNMNYDDPYQDLHIHQSKGYRLLDGEDAMEVVRWRQNNNGDNYGDTTRVEVQQAFLKAVAAQCLKLENWTKVSDFATILFENVETDIPVNNILWFAQQAMGLDLENIQFFTMPGDLNSYAWSRTYRSNQSYAFADPEGMVELVNQYFNPYTREIAEEDLQIMYRNRNGSLGVTNGTLADSRAASAPVRTSSTSGSSSSSSSSSAGSSGTTSAPAEEPVLPGEGETSAAGPETDAPLPEGGEAADPGTEGGASASPAPETPADPGAEPQLPGEPALPEEGTDSGVESGGTAPVEDSAPDGVDTEPPGWL